jgi:hypothetical protein
MQTAIVTLVALSALAIVGRRIYQAIKPPAGTAACPSCASGSDACRTSEPARTKTNDVQPLVLVRSKR